MYDKPAKLNIPADKTRELSKWYKTNRNTEELERQTLYKVLPIKIMLKTVANKEKEIQLILHSVYQYNSSRNTYLADRGHINYHRNAYYSFTGLQ